MTIQIKPAPSSACPSSAGPSSPARGNRRREAGRRELSEARRARDIVTLLDRHDELRGVYPLADLIDDAVRWTA